MLLGYDPSGQILVGCLHIEVFPTISCSKQKLLKHAVDHNVRDAEHRKETYVAVM